MYTFPGKAGNKRVSKCLTQTCLLHASQFADRSASSLLQITGTIFITALGPFSVTRPLTILSNSLKIIFVCRSLSGGIDFLIDFLGILISKKRSYVGCKNILQVYKSNCPNNKRQALITRG